MASPHSLYFYRGAIILLLLLSGWLAYQVFDQAVTIGYHRSSMEYRTEQRDTLHYLATSLSEGMTREEILNLLQENKELYIIDKNDGTVAAGEIWFEFEGQHLKAIHAE